MKLMETIIDKHSGYDIPFYSLSQTQKNDIRDRATGLSGFEISKLIKDLENIKNGGSKWRLQASTKGYAKSNVDL